MMTSPRPSAGRPDVALFNRLESQVRSYSRAMPRQFVSAEGPWMHDASGGRYLDFLSGCSTLNYGHNHPVLKEALVDYIVSSRDSIPPAPAVKPDTLQLKDYAVRIERLVETGFRSAPWGIEFADARRALITELRGGLRWLVDGKLDPEPIVGVPETIQYGTGGMMDLALDPDYAQNGWVYIGYVVVAFLISRRAGWPLTFLLLMLVAGLVPLLIFWVERTVAARLRSEHLIEETGSGSMSL